MTDPMDAEIAEAKAEAKGATPDYGTIEFDGVEYAIEHKPNTLLLSELARTNSGEPEALAVYADFFETTLGPTQYRKFKRAVFRKDDVEEELGRLLREVLEKSLGRPTE